MLQSLTGVRRKHRSIERVCVFCLGAGSGLRKTWARKKAEKYDALSCRTSGAKRGCGNMFWGRTWRAMAAGTISALTQRPGHTTVAGPLALSSAEHEGDRWERALSIVSVKQIVNCHRQRGCVLPAALEDSGCSCTPRCAATRGYASCGQTRTTQPAPEHSADP
jgi:hypothetical protein